TLFASFLPVKRILSALITMTLSPQSTCGVKLVLCLPRSTLAMIVAARPTTRPSASTRCHFFSTSAGLTDLVVFISAFMGDRPFELKRERAALSGSAVGGHLSKPVPKVKQMRGFLDGYHDTRSREAVRRAAAGPARRRSLRGA